MTKIPRSASETGDLLGVLVALDDEGVTVAGHGVPRALEQSAGRRPGRRPRRRVCETRSPSRSSTRPLASSLPSPMIETEWQTCWTSARMCELSSTVTPGLAQAADHVADVADAGRVEPVRRLVEDQQVGALQQGGGDRQPLPHAERVAVGSGRARGRSAPPAAARRRQRFGAGPIDAGQQREVAPPEKVGEKRGSSTTAPTRSITSGSCAGTCRPKSRHLPAVGSGEAEQHPDRRGLAGAVGAEEAVHAAARHRRSRPSTATSRRPPVR